MFVPSKLRAMIKRLLRPVVHWYRRTHAFPPVAWEGHCPICQRDTTFRAEHEWFRDHLLCLSCRSIPRERALMLTLEQLAPDWRELRIHESSPINRGVSPLLQRCCPGYVASQLFNGVPRGTLAGGIRCEDLERQTFPDGSFDLVITQDVTEHVFEPAAVYREIWRTLRPNGLYLHTVPIYKQRMSSAKRATRRNDGSIKHLARPEYHGNPVDERGSLVTWHYGYDLHELIALWAPFAVEIRRFRDRWHGIVAEFTEVVVCRKLPRPSLLPDDEES
jgi:hypothetical protein